MNNEDIKKIAESMGKCPQIAKHFGEEVVTCAGDFPYGHKSFIFNPLESDADAFKVLEALLTTQQSTLQISVGAKKFYIENLSFGGCDTDGDTTLRDAICQAYLERIV